MSTITRRDILASSAGVAALGLTGTLAFPRLAMADDLRRAGFYKYKLGSDVEVISIYDGIWEKKHDENFIVDVDVETTKKVLRAGGETDAFVPVEFAFTLIKTGGKTILIDAGTGTHFKQIGGKAAVGLKGAGIAPEDIDTIIVSHMHPDHVFGLFQPQTLSQLYPNAEILIGEREYGFWTDPGVIDRLPERRKGSTRLIQKIFPNWKNVSLFSGDKEIAPGIRPVEAFGHSPGHLAFHVASGREELLVLGDAIIVPALFLANLDWQVAFDADPDQATASRRALVERAVADNILIAGYHFGFPNSGRILRDGKGFVFDAVQS